MLSPKMLILKATVMNKAQKYNVASLSSKEKVSESLRRSIPLLPEEARQQVATMLTPQTLEIATRTLTGWAVSRFFGISEICDALLLVVGVAFVREDFFSGAEELSKYSMTA